MTVLGWVLDGTLAAVLLLLALRIIQVRGLFQAVVLFIAFGLLMALAWVRLSAPDIALAEAGIGAALTGVLLVDTLHYLRWTTEGRPKEQESPTPWPIRTPGFWLRLATGGLAAGTFLLLVLVLLELPGGPAGLTSVVDGALPGAGVDHPVTAVLLNFRSLDTMLELAVLVAAVMGVLSVMRTPDFSGLPLPATADGVVRWLLRSLIPLMVLVAGYLLWLGSFAPGGAFQSGVVVAAMGVFLWLSGRRSLELLPAVVRGTLLVVGLSAFLVVGAVLLASGREFLEYPGEAAGGIILLLELAGALSLGVGLTALFVALHPPGEGPPPIDEHP